LLCGTTIGGEAIDINFSLPRWCAFAARFANFSIGARGNDELSRAFSAQYHPDCREQNP